MSLTEVKLTRRVETLRPLTDSFEWNTPVDSDVTSVLLCHHCMTGYGWEVTLQTTSTKLPLVGARTCLFNDILGRRTACKCETYQQLITCSLCLHKVSFMGIGTPSAEAPSSSNVNLNFLIVPRISCQRRRPPYIVGFHMPCHPTFTQNKNLFNFGNIEIFELQLLCQNYD